MTPDTLAKAATEHSEQRALFAWANMAARFGFAAAWDDQCYTAKGYAQAVYNGFQHVPVPALERLFAIPNGGYRDKITAGKLKAEGVKRGVPDIMLPVPMFRDWKLGRDCQVVDYCGLFVELKRRKTETQRAGVTSNEQDDWTGYLRGAGYAVAVAFGWRDAAKQIEQYLKQSGG